MVDIKKLKSVTVITDPGKMRDTLAKTAEKVRNPVEMSEHDGRLTLTKAMPGVLAPNVFTMPDDDALEAMADNIGLPWEPEYAKRCIPFWGSDERPDRHGDIVEQSWNFNEFKSNPVLLDAHNWEAPPIGNVLNWQTLNRNDEGYNGPALLLLCLFATEDQSQVADSLFRLAKAKILRTGSVGFYPGSMVTVSDPAERATLGLGQYGFVYQDNDLLEYSMATIPANAGAYQLMLAAKKSGILRATDIVAIRESKRLQLLHKGGDNKNHEWKKSEIAWAMFWKTFFPKVKFDVSLDVEEPLNVPQLLADINEIVRKPKRKDDDGDPDVEEDDSDPDDVTVTDMLGGMTNMLTGIHDKLSDHSNKLDDCTESLGGVHDKLDNIIDTLPPPAQKPSKSRSNAGLAAMESLMSAAAD